MNKFKKGDFCVCTRNLNYSHNSIQCGEKFTVHKVHEDDVYYTDRFALDYRNVQLIEAAPIEPYDHQAYIEKNRRKPVFKVGDFIKDSYGVYVPITEVNAYSIHYLNSKLFNESMGMNFIREKNIQPWEPKTGDVVLAICYEAPPYCIKNTITTFVQKLDTHYVTTSGDWDCIMPYSGGLPEAKCLNQKL